jgi:uncharacterized protein YeaO (DUF488 family)
VDDMTDKRVRVGRIYADPAAADGTLVLVDRIWPRGVRKEREAAVLTDLLNGPTNT